MKLRVLVFVLWFGGVITAAEEWEDVGTCGVGLKCGPECQRLCLVQHNYYRSLHNSPPLKCDPKLAKSAQDWADSNAFDGAVQRSNPTEDFVESISWKKWGWEGMATREAAIPAAVRSWYSEIKNGYDFDTGKSNGTVMHFKSVVHSHEATLGCGINIKPGDGTYVVAHYGLKPTDDYKLKDFTPLKKVGRRNMADPRCDLKSREREHCGNTRSPFVTPDKCIQAGCCYDDIFLDEPGLQWHNEQASTWCFKRKDRMTNKKTNTSIPKAGGSALGGGQPPTETTTPGRESTTPSAAVPGPFPAAVPGPPPAAAPGPPPAAVPGPPPAAAPGPPPAAVPGPPPATANCSPGIQCSSLNAALGNVIAMIDTVTKFDNPKGNGQGDKGGTCLGESCYSFQKTGGAWTQNQKACKGQNGDLVSMETEAEWKFINQRIQNMTNPTENEWHVGLQEQGVWKWVNGKPLTIKKWQSGQPSGDGSYAVMAKAYPAGTQGLFNDLPDWIPRGFICEFPKGGAQPGTTQPTGGIPPLTGTTQPTPIQPGSTKPGSTKPGSTQPSGGATTALPTSPVGGNPGGMTEFEKDCLKAHNDYRAKHGTPPLTWSKELQEQAQEWANYLATINNMKHDTESIENKGVGENLAYFTYFKSAPSQCQGPKKEGCVQCREMVADWYAEEPNFDYSKGESKGGVILHFTQVIWKDTKQLGMATATSNDKFFTVARYKPRGNMGYPEDFKRNVPPVQ